MCNVQIRMYYQHLLLINFALQVPLGVILKNEMKGDEMVEIVKHLHQYVPSVEYSEQVTISSSENVTLVKSTSHQILLGGDQLTAARVRSAQRSRLNSETISEKLSGFIAVVEDWHTKANFLGVSIIFDIIIIHN